LLQHEIWETADGIDWSFEQMPFTLGLGAIEGKPVVTQLFLRILGSVVTVAQTAILTTWLSYLPAHSAEIMSSFGQDGSCALTFYGDIENGDENLFDVLSGSCAGGGVLYKSNGGDLFAGLRIGEMIRERGLETAVSYDATCASACALAWLGGTKRYMFAESKIGFHAAYIVEDSEAKESGLGNALVGAYLTRIGLSVETVVFATSAKPDEMNWLNYFDASGVGITANLLGDSDREWIDSLDQKSISKTH
jgi:hypothetical protein